MPIPTEVKDKLQTKTHKHSLPLCDNEKHDPSCKDFKKESKCVFVRKPKKNGEFKEYAQCTHFLWD